MADRNFGPPRLKRLSCKQEIMSSNLIGACAGLSTLKIQVMIADPLESRGLLDASIPEDKPDITKGWSYV